MPDQPDHDGPSRPGNRSGTPAFDVRDRDAGGDVSAGDGVRGGDARPTIERVVLNASPEGQRIAAGFVDVFGRFVSDEVRPLLREVAAAGEEPQLLVNGLAQLLRDTAEAIEMPVGHPDHRP